MSDKTMMPKTSLQSSTRMLTLTGLMAAVLCILGPFSIPLPFSPVPLSLTNFFIYIAVFLLGMKYGTISVLIYLCLGAAGLPVFSGFGGGLGKLAGPTGGYLIGFLFTALIQGFLRKRFPGEKTADIAGMIGGLAVCYIFGTLWLAWQTHLTPAAALGIGVIPYLPGDVVKILLASFIGPKLLGTIKKI